MALTVTHQGTPLTAGITVWDSAPNTLREGVQFFSAVPAVQASGITWDTHYSLRIGVREIAASNWEISFYLIYGSPNDRRPYYSRVPVQVSINGETVDVDVVAAPMVVGHGQGIPPTVVVWNPVTETIVSSEEGHELAFIETKRIHKNHREGGFDDDGVFVIRYDHTIENEGRETFYVAACWPCQWVKSDGSFLRGDGVPVVPIGQGFSVADGGPYGNAQMSPPDTSSAIYPITHIGTTSQDASRLTTGWTQVPYGQRADSGIGPFCGNIISRGSSSMLDFGMAWLLKSIAAMELGNFPSPYFSHSRNPFLSNYDEDAMRAKGRTTVTLVWIWRALGVLAEVRSGDPEVTVLRDALAHRIAEILILLKADFDNGSYIEYRDNTGPNPANSQIAYWELGHYFQGLVVIQETIEDLFGVIDPKIHEMMVEFATEIYDHTYDWDLGHPHPGGAVWPGRGWQLEYITYLNQPNLSIPTGITDRLVIVYEWLKAHKINLGTKLDEIIAQFAGVDYKWHLGSVAEDPQVLFTGAAVAMEMTASVTATETAHTGAAVAMELHATVNPTVSNPTIIPIGVPVVVASTATPALGEPIVVEEDMTISNDSLFTVVRGDDFIQPFTIELDQSRTLDGSESWRAAIKARKEDATPLAVFVSPTTIAIDPSTFQPSMVFTPATLPLASFPSDEKPTDYWFDLEMVKDGSIETKVVAKLTVVGDISQ